MQKNKKLLDRVTYQRPFLASKKVNKSFFPPESVCKKFDLLSQNSCVLLDFK